MKNATKIAFLLIIALAFFSAGCWDQSEVEQLALVRAIAIDYLPEREAPYLVTLAVNLPSDIAGGEGGGNSTNPTQLFTGIGASVELALEQISYSVPRRLYLSHTELLIISQDVAKNSLSKVFDFAMRHPEIRASTYLIVTAGLAQKALTTSERIESTVSEEILGVVRHAEKTRATDAQQLFEFARDIANPGQEAYTSLLMVGSPLEKVLPELKEEEQPGGQAESGENGAGTGGGAGEELEDIVTLAGLAVFKGKKMVGILDAIDTRGFLWFLGGTGQTIIEVHDPVDPDSTVDILVYRVNSKLTPVIKNNKVSFIAEVNVEGDVRSRAVEIDYITPEIIKKLNTAMAGVIKADMEKALSKMQELQTDIVGFGAMLNRKDAKTFNRLKDRWDEVFSTMKVDITVKTNIRRTGLHVRPIKNS